VEENNSEQTLVKVMGVIALVTVALGAAVSALVDTPLSEQWPWLGTVALIFGALAKVAGDYVQSRPGKHLAMAEKIKAEALAANPTSPPSP